MSTQTGVMFVCDRCGATHFENCGRYVDDIPDGWVEFAGNNGIHRVICPQCAVPFKRFMGWFFNDNCPMTWRE